MFRRTPGVYLAKAGVYAAVPYLYLKHGLILKEEVAAFNELWFGSLLLALVCASIEAGHAVTSPLTRKEISPHPVIFPHNQ